MKQGVAMRISAICAMSENRVIGCNNKLPWHLPADLRHFKKLTLGKPILLGRKTYESIGRPLPDRCNVVITRDMDFKAPGCVVVNSIEHALDAVAYSEEVFIVGGSLLYQQTLSLTQRLYVTIIHQDFEGDTFFPDTDPQEWKEIEHVNYSADAENPYPYSFIVLDRK
jgi:dihydrofolate reductase